MYGIAACYRTATDTGMIRHSTTIKWDFLSSFPNCHFVSHPCFSQYHSSVAHTAFYLMVPAFFTGTKSGRDVKLTIHCHPMPTLWMRGAIPLIPVYVFQGMDREGFTFIF
jgi:hypothetical protein